ncbi:hypothetical protein DFH07DRAFT_1056348 [Mycena maculata]|uniref:Uncharacterized protein n=1 Tax=Mycena maculata TaxID=230809 RepID=A0AAD7K6W1_9AGAR|nr:hypothetical protein DFH07DRAFT_1056348 [Mycena maculata]
MDPIKDAVSRAAVAEDLWTFEAGLAAFDEIFEDLTKLPNLRHVEWVFSSSDHHLDLPGAVAGFIARSLPRLRNARPLKFGQKSVVSSAELHEAGHI